MGGVVENNNEQELLLEKLVIGSGLGSSAGQVEQHDPPSGDPKQTAASSLRAAESRCNGRQVRTGVR